VHQYSKTSSLENRFINERKILMNSIISISELSEKLKFILRNKAKRRKENVYPYGYTIITLEK
jgi:hypothetical protein